MRTPLLTLLAAISPAQDAPRLPAIDRAMEAMIAELQLAGAGLTVLHEGAVVRQGGIQKLVILGPGQVARSQRLEVRGGELGVEQGEPALAPAGHAFERQSHPLLLHLLQHLEGEAVVDLGEVDVRGGDPGPGEGLRGRMLIYDALYGETRTIRLKPRPGCPDCGA